MTGLPVIWCMSVYSAGPIRTTEFFLCLLQQARSCRTFSTWNRTAHLAKIKSLENRSNHTWIKWLWHGSRIRLKIKCCWGKFSRHAITFRLRWTHRMRRGRGTWSWQPSSTGESMQTWLKRLNCWRTWAMQVNLHCCWIVADKETAQ